MVTNQINSTKVSDNRYYIQSTSDIEKGVTTQSKANSKSPPEVLRAPSPPIVAASTDDPVTVNMLLEHNYPRKYKRVHHMENKWSEDIRSEEKKSCTRTLSKNLEHILEVMSNNEPSFVSDISASLLERNNTLCEDDPQITNDEKMLSVKVTQLLNNFVRDRLGER